MPVQSGWAEICFLSLEFMTVMTRVWFKKPQEIVSNAFRDAFNFEANALSTHPHHEPCLASVQGAVQKNDHLGTRGRFSREFYPQRGSVYGWARDSGAPCFGGYNRDCRVTPRALAARNEMKYRTSGS